MWDIRSSLKTQSFESIEPDTIAEPSELVYIIEKLVLSRFVGMMREYSEIFDTRDTYSCYSNKGEFLNFDENKYTQNIKGISKGLDISAFGIFEYSVRSESGCMIALRDREHYVPGLENSFPIIPPQGINT